MILKYQAIRLSLLSLAVVSFAALAVAQPAKDAPPLTSTQLETIWKTLIEHDDAGSKQALVGMQALVRSPQSAVPFIKEHVKPVPAPDAKQIETLIGQLDGGFQVREKATQSLEAMGVVAVPAMEKKLEGSPSPEARQRLEALIGKTDDKAMTAEELRACRAIETLTAIGTPEAKSALDTLAKGGPGAMITEQAKAASVRLSRQSAAK